LEKIFLEFFNKNVKGILKIFLRNISQKYLTKIFLRNISQIYLGKYFSKYFSKFSAQNLPKKCFQNVPGPSKMSFGGGGWV